MKRIISLITTAIFAVTSTAAQNGDIKSKSPIARDSIATFNVDSNTDMKLVLDSDRDGVAISLAGYNITLAGVKKTEKQGSKKRTYSTRVKSSLLSSARFGFISLSTPNYNGYSVENQDFLELNRGKSIMFGVDVLGYEVATLDKRFIFEITTGLTTYNYTFANSITPVSHDGVITPVVIDDSFKKSKLRTTYATLPISMAYRLAPKVYFRISAYGGLILNSVAKYKDPIVKERVGGVNPLLLGTTLELNYKSIGIFWSYNTTPLFKSGVGPDTRVSSIGISIR